ncbi:MAG: hypothetical protein ACYC1M_15295 [Armatimonadota bacterium]
MKVHRLAVWFLLPVLAGCTRLSQEPINPPAGLNAQQKVEWSTSHCIRSVKERRPWIERFVDCRCAYNDFLVTIISPDGTALASYRDAVLKPASAFKSVPADVKQQFLDRATQKQYYLHAVNGRRYPYHVTAIAADCESAILKPMKPIPPQPYIDIRRLEVPKTGQSYRVIVGPVHAEEPVSLITGNITVSRLVDGAASASTNLLFRESDRSLMGFCQSTETGYLAAKDLKPLQRFIEANSSVRFVDTQKLKPGQPVKP